MSAFARGGNDTYTMSGGSGGPNTFYGDNGGNLSAYVRGGNDTFVGGGANSVILAYGDAGGEMSSYAHGGNDTLTGADESTPLAARAYNNALIGDAQTMSGNAHGGNDKLISGTGNDDMWDDAQILKDNAKGGNDTFVFKLNNGHDKIEDFGQGLPESNLGAGHIDVRALGIHDFSQLNISDYDPLTQQSTITFSVGSDLIVHSAAALTQNNFIFA